MSLGLFTALFLLVGFPILIIWAIIKDNKDDKKHALKCEKELADWMVEQLSLDKYKVVVTTKSGKKYKTPSMYPYGEVVYSIDTYVYTRTSFESAQNFIESSIKADRFYHAETCKFIPLCEIKDFAVVTA